MLDYFFLKLRWVNYIKNNFYFDFGLKFVVISFVYNIYINLAYFFAEKYIIEYNTRYAFNYTALLFYKSAFRLDSKKLFFYTAVFFLNIAVALI